MKAILMYHAVGEVADDPYRLAVSPGRLERQMRTLGRLGLRGVSVGDLVDAMAAGRARGLVGLSFDDGYAGMLDQMLPILRRHGFGATVFVVTERLGGSNDWDTKGADSLHASRPGLGAFAGPVWPLLDPSGVRQLAAAGVEIGSHTATHARLERLEPGRLKTEVTGSRDQLAELLGAPPRGFAYPYGSLDVAAVEAVRDAGYAYACAVSPPRSGVSPHALPRSYVGERDGAVRLTAKWALHGVRVVLRGGSL